MKGRHNTPFTDLKRLRQQFPLLSRTVHGQPLLYLDNAATTQKPLSVIEAVEQFYRQGNANVHRASHYLSACTTQAFEVAREITREFINARFVEEIIWTRGATEAINLVANSWGRSILQSGDEIILTRLEHHANIIPWQLLTAATGAIIRVVELDESGGLDMEQFEQLLSAKTRLVAVTHSSNATGTITPIKQIIALAHHAGALVLVDGSQAVAHQRVDVQALGADFYVFSGHKVYGPTGIGVLYGRRELLESMPPWQGGGEMIEWVSFAETRFNGLPFKFEAGTPNIAGAIGLGQALTFLSGLDFAALHAHENRLRRCVEQGLAQINAIRLIGQAERKAPVVSFISRDYHNQDIGLILDQQGIAIRTGHHCAMPLMESLNLTGTVRASFALYNTKDEAIALVEAMATLHHNGLFAVAGEIKHETTSQTTPAKLPEIFVHQTMDLNAITERLQQVAGWQERYRQIMLLGKDLPALPEDWKIDQARLHGCESSVWLHYHYHRPTMRLYFAADSDARVIRGLITIVLAAFSGKTPAEIVKEDIDARFRKLELFTHLSPSRGNGLRAIVREIQTTARRYC